jgi:hypothetical protein
MPPASSRRRLAWTLGITFLVVAVAPMALFYGLDFRLEHYGRHPIHTCWDAKSDNFEASTLWWKLAFFVGPLTAGVLAYFAVVLFAPGRLGRSRWRFVFGLPVAALATVSLFFAAFSGILIYESCPS